MKTDNKNLKIDIEKFPLYLKNDIEKLMEAEEKERNGERCWHIDCLQNELYCSLGCAFREGKISKEEAVYLHKKFLGIEVNL